MRQLSVLLSIGTLTLVGGCASGPEVTEYHGVAVLIDHDDDGSMDALLEGTLADVGGCLGVEVSAAPRTAYAVVWPDGIEVVREDPFTVRLEDGSEYALGEDISIGGGEGGFLDRDSDVQPDDFCPGVQTWRAH